MAAAWIAIVALTALPWIADRVDPLPPLQTPADGNLLALSSFILDASTRGLQRIWIIATGIALVVATLGLVFGALLLNRRLRPPHRLLYVTCLPLPALLIAVVVFVTRDPV